MTETLSLKLKQALVKQLKKDKKDLDRVYLVSPNGTAKSSWTLREIIYEIEEETKFGIELLTNIIMLSIDFLSRNTTKLK